MKAFRLIQILTLLMLITATLPSCRDTKVITFRSLLSEMSDPESITRFPDPGYRLVQQSSYDRSSIHRDSAGWFANNDYTHFIREEENSGRREFVMFDSEGPGVIVRWWMTFGNTGALNSYIRVYLDGMDVPVLEGNAPSLVGGGILAPDPLSTAVSPLTEPQRQGYNLYLPIPYSVRCKITLENSEVVITPERRSPSIYFSVSARSYERGTRVVSLRKEMIKADSLAIAECISSLTDTEVVSSNRVTMKSSSGSYPPGSANVISFSEKNRAITSLSLLLTSAGDSALLHDTWIRLSFDGEEAVNMPAGIFFGTGYAVHPYKTRFSSADSSGVMICKFIMPFRSGCEVALLNKGNDTATFGLKVAVAPYNWDSSSMYFRASWAEHKGIETAGSEHTGGTGRHTDLTYLDISGRGVYAGDAVTVFNTVDAWWGEGDEKIYVDGETFPSSFGTGTEDYYGYAWCRPEPFSHPFIAQPAGFGNFHPGMSVNMRYRGLDAIPFSESIRSDIELWHWLRTKIDYILTSYYYIAPGD